MELRQAIWSACRSASSTVTATTAISTATRPTASALLFQPQKSQQQKRGLTISAKNSANARFIDTLRQQLIKKGAHKTGNSSKTPPPAPPSMVPTPNANARGFALPEQIRQDKQSTLADLTSRYASSSSATGGSRLTPFDKNDFTNKWNMATEENLKLRLRPTLGSTVHVTHGRVDAHMAFRMMESIVKRNKVKQHFTAGRFHERPALKRKRKLRESWRQRFRNGFDAAVKRTLELKGQGW